MRRRNQWEKSGRWISGASIVLKKQKASKYHVEPNILNLTENKINELRRVATDTGPKPVSMANI